MRRNRLVVVAGVFCVFHVEALHTRMSVAVHSSKQFSAFTSEHRPYNHLELTAVARLDALSHRNSFLDRNLTEDVLSLWLLRDTFLKVCSCHPE
jgi:hypothetical protein